MRHIGMLLTGGLFVSFLGLHACKASGRQIPAAVQKDALRPWVFPGAKLREWNGIPTFYQGSYSASAGFEKVWDFYWKKIVPANQERLPLNHDSVHIGHFGNGARRYQWGFVLPRPGARVGSLFLRGSNRTVTVLISQGDQEEETRVVIQKDLDEPRE